MSWNNYTTLNTSAGHRSSILGVGGGISSAAAPTAAMPTTSSAVADDVGLEFDLGTDAQINDDLYRTLRDECTEIDKSLTVTSTNVKNMERSFTQLTKDHNHSRNEMFNYGRNAADELESVTLDEDVRVGFKDQFERLVAPHVVVSPENAVVAHEDDGVDASIVIDSHDGNHGSNANNNGTTTSSTKQCRSFSHKKFITTKKSGSKSKQSSIQTIQKEIKATRKKVKQTDEATSNLSREMNARQLDRVKAESERMVEAKRRELEAETQRNRGVKEAVAVARKNSGAYAQRIHDKSKEQTAERVDNLAKEAQLTSHNTARQDELLLLEAEEKKLDMELAALSGQLDFLTKCAVEFEAEQKKSIDIKGETETVQKDIAELTSSKDGKSKEAEASNAELESAVAAFDDASKTMANANAQKLENDKASVDVLEPAVARKADAIKEKESLAGEIVALQTSIEQAQNSNKDSVTESESSVIAKSTELKDHKDKLDKARGDFEQLQKDGAVAHQELVEELNGYKEFTNKFEAATTAEMTNLATLKDERRETRVALIEKRKAELDVVEDAHQSDIENLKRLHAYLEEQKELKHLIDDKGVELDEDGNEIDPIEYEDDGDDFSTSSTMKNEDGSPAVKRGD